MIECENLTHYYGKRLIYENLSFRVPEGRILGLLGKNGTGKTTTINILSGFLRPRSGVCRIFGQDITSMPPQLRRDIGLLIEGHVQYTFMNISQIEKFYSRFYPGWRRDVYYDLMSMLKVAPQQQISRMSCGQRSQVALGLLMAQNPSLLILDDFSLGLDPGYRRLFIDYLRDFVKTDGKTVFLTSHIIQDMERLIDDCIIMDYGRILILQLHVPDGKPRADRTAGAVPPHPQERPHGGRRAHAAAGHGGSAQVKRHSLLRLLRQPRAARGRVHRTHGKILI